MAGHVHGATSGKYLWISLAITLTFVAFEIIYGLRSHSLALVSDAGHNASDALALGLAAYAIWVARRPATHKKTFGYHRVAILTALINAATLIVIAIAILIEAVQVFRHPAPVQGGTVMAVSAVAVVMNTLIAYWLRGGSHHSLNARAAYIHMAGDALSSLGVLIAGAAVKYAGWQFADPIVSVLISGFILYSSYGVITEATNILLEGTPAGLDVADLVGAIRTTPPVADVHDLHLWTVGDGIHFLSCHVVLPDALSMAEGATVVRDLNTMLHDRFNIGHATIQIETGDCDGCRIDPQELYCELTSRPVGCGHGHAHEH